ncbi:hypothetical protein R1sor_010420 [Riccia sorocarpa]|uniref:Uncharacterized protein n=1 Tax=Riccia sorocarpa TaxID=122646 RepID=A0ABD3I1F2_9MARC
MKLIRPLAPIPPSWWTTGGGVSFLQNAKTRSDGISVQRPSPFQDLVYFASSTSINSRTSVETMVHGTKIYLNEMRLKVFHRFPKKCGNDGGQDGFIGLTGATDLHRRHRVTLESSLGSNEGKRSASAFVSSKFEPRISWGIALSRRLQHAVTFFGRFNCDESGRHRFILQVVQKVDERNTVSPIFSKLLGDKPQAGLSWTYLLGDTARPRKSCMQVKMFWSGSGAYSLSIKAQAGELDEL